MEMTTGNAAPAASTFAEGDEAMLDGEMVEIVQLVTTPDGVEMAVLDNDVVVPVASLEPVGDEGTAPVPPAAVASAKPCACTKTAADMAHGDVPVALPEQDNPDVKGMLGAMQESIMAILDLVQRIDSNGRTAAARLIPELADFDAMAARLAMSYVVTDAPAIASYGEVRLSDGTLAVATYALGSTADGVRMYEVKRISEDGTFEEVGTLYAEGDLEATGKQYDYRHNSDADVVITDATGEVVPA